CFGHRLMFDAVVPGGIRPLRGESRVVGLEPLLEAADAALGAEWREVLRSCDRAAEGAGADAVRVQVLERLDGARRALRSARDGVLAVSTSGELAAPVAAVPDGEGFGAAPSFRGMLHCWIRMRAGVVDCVHWQDPAVARLHGVLERGRGMRTDRFELLCRAARVSVPGIDQ
ncbi:MAG: hypothetical protein INR65_01035, partial [Gluconacetobacter diazotrophicus]|nr:hypothetical protein [Gluconacetobacter diazotrophicus]